MSGFQPIGELLPDLPRRPTPDDAQLTDTEELILELTHVGIGLRKAEFLVAHFSPRRIRRQLNWLPLRSARKPASLLITAIEQDYDAPAYGDEHG